jgi:hypothetical protein
MVASYGSITRRTTHSLTRRRTVSKKKGVEPDLTTPTPGQTEPVPMTEEPDAVEPVADPSVPAEGDEG